MMKLFGVYAGYLLYLEIVYHLGCFGFSAGNPVFALPLIVILAGLETFLTGAVKWKRRSLWIILCTELVLFCAQFVYLSIFRQPLLWEAAFRGGQDALTNYWREALEGIWKALPFLLLMALPHVVIGVLIRRKILLLPEFHSIEKLRSMLAIGVGVILCGMTLTIGKLVDADFYNDYNEFYDPFTVARNMGAMPMVLRDTQRSIGGAVGSVWAALTAGGNEEPADKGSDDEAAGPETGAEPNVTGSGDGGSGGSGGSGAGGNTVGGSAGQESLTADGNAGAQDSGDDSAASARPDTSPNQLPLDFAYLKERADSKEAAWMAEYMEGISPTKRNKFTGIFKDYNLIYLSAEGFSTYAVREDLTPTLYRMLHSGFIFDNYYVPLWQTSTSDGEYINCTGLIPDGQFSMRKSASNDMAFTLPRYFAREGVTSLAYHNNSLSYYDRYLTHPNLGYDFKGAKLGELDEAEWGDKVFPMENPDAWPASDLEMMQGTAPEYINMDRFHVYYMTVSGHMNYNFKGNAMSGKNREAVENLDMSENARAYIACNIELDKALENLLQQLEAAGKLENTVICMSADHYPYGMTQEQYEELAGKPLSENLDLYRNSLFLWNAQMEDHPVRVEKVCGSMDIVPTLLNLFGFEYDSRLYAGKDIFSDEEGMVIFNDRSFITDTVIYNKKGKSTVWKADLQTQQENAQQSPENAQQAQDNTQQSPENTQQSPENTQQPPENTQQSQGNPETTDEAVVIQGYPSAAVTEEEREQYLKEKKQDVKCRYQFSAFMIQKDYYRVIREALEQAGAAW